MGWGRKHNLGLDALGLCREIKMISVMDDECFSVRNGCKEIRNFFYLVRYFVYFLKNCLTMLPWLAWDLLYRTG